MDTKRERALARPPGFTDWVKLGKRVIDVVSFGVSAPLNVGLKETDGARPLVSPWWNTGVNDTRALDLGVTP